MKVKGAERCVEAVEYLNETKPVGKNVVIIGGGLSGCEIAYDLYLKGKNPTIVEAQNDLMVSKTLCLANSSYLRDFFKLNKVPTYLESKVLEINKDNVMIALKNGEKKQLKADSVISAIGYNPNPLATKKVYVVGDANGVGNLRTVVWRAWEVAEKI